MTGGQAQIDAESKLAAHSHGRLESLLRGARTDECRDEIITAYQRYMGAQALVSRRLVLFCFVLIGSVPRCRWGGKRMGGG